MAVAYPILTIALFWGWTGEAQNFGSFTIFPAEDRVFVHFGFLLGLLTAAACFVLSFYHQLTGKKRLASRYRFAAIAVALVGTFAGAVSFALAVALAGAVAGAGAGAVGFASATRKGTAPVMGYSYILLVLIAVLLLTSTIIEQEEGGRSLLLFLGVLPILNGFFDFVSFGATRVLIRYGVAHRGRWTWLLWSIYPQIGTAYLSVFVWFNNLIGPDLPLEAIWA